MKPEYLPLTIYWTGVAKTNLPSEDQKRDGLLDLLRLPAVFGEQQPEIAAAGLARSMHVLEKLGDANGSVRVRRELLSQYSQTYHAGLQKTPQRNTEEKR